MEIAADDFLVTKKSVFTENAAFVRAQTQYHEKITAIQDTESKKGEIKTGKSDVKDVSRDNLEDAIFSVISPICAYAHEKEKPDILARFDKAESALTRMTDNALTTFGDEVYSFAKPLVAVLDDYAVTAEEIEMVNTCSAQFKGNIGSMGTSKADSVTATQNVEDQIRDAKKFLENRVDKLVVKYRLSNADFYNGYKNVRQVLDLGTRHKKDDSSSNTQNPPETPTT